jgi:polysaccharide biosynthesis transport protein
MAVSNSPSDLSPYLNLLARRWLAAVVVFLCVSAIGVIGARMQKPTYIAEGKLKFEKLSPTSSVTGVGKEVGRLEPLVDKSNPLSTEAEVIRAVVAQQTIDQLQLHDPKNKALKSETFLKQLIVSEIRGTDILKITYRDTDPEMAAKVVNTLLDIYLKQNLLSRRSQVGAARQFIQAQLPQAEMSVKQAEDDLRQFKEMNNVVALKEESTSVVTVLSSLQQQISAMRGQIADLEAQTNVLQNKLGIDSQQAIGMTIVSQAPAVQETLKQLQQVENQLAHERSLFQDGNPVIRSLEDERNNLQALLQTRIAQLPGSQAVASNGSLQIGTLQQDLTKEMVALASKRQGFIHQLEILLKTQRDYQLRSSLLPNLEKEQRELERKLEASQSTYTQLLQKDGEIRVAKNQNLGNAQIISEARIPDQPVSKKISYLAALLLGLLAAGGVVFVLESRGKPMKSLID